MAKKIRREVMINGTKRWVSGSNEQEYKDGCQQKDNRPCAADYPSFAADQP